MYAGGSSVRVGDEAVEAEFCEMVSDFAGSATGEASDISAHLDSSVLE